MRSGYRRVGLDARGHLATTLRREKYAELCARTARDSPRYRGSNRTGTGSRAASASKRDDVADQESTTGAGHCS